MRKSTFRPNRTPRSPVSSLWAGGQRRAGCGICENAFSALGRFRDSSRKGYMIRFLFRVLHRFPSSFVWLHFGEPLAFSDVHGLTPNTTYVRNKPFQTAPAGAEMMKTAVFALMILRRIFNSSFSFVFAPRNSKFRCGIPRND